MPPSRPCSGRCAGGACSSKWITRATPGNWPKPGGRRSPRRQTRPNEVWQLDFSAYETTTGGIWRLAGVTDYFTKIEHGWHISPTCTGADAIEAVRIAIAEAERLSGAPLLSLPPVNPDTGLPHRIKLVTDNGGAFKGAAFARFIASRPELLHIHTRANSPGQNGVRERGFGSLTYEHLYRVHTEIAAEHPADPSAPGSPHQSRGLCPRTRRRFPCPCARAWSRAPGRTPRSCRPKSGATHPRRAPAPTPRADQGPGPRVPRSPHRDTGRRWRASPKDAPEQLDIRVIAEPGQHEQGLLKAGQQPCPTAGAASAPLALQQPGHEGDLLLGHVKSDTTAVHAEPLR
jgi:hypothetical protein